MYLKKAQWEKPCLYNVVYDKHDLVDLFALEIDETIRLAKESRSKINYYYNDHMCAIIRSYDIDQFTDLVCQLGEKTDQCKRLKTELSKRTSQKTKKDFANLEKHCINLKLDLQNKKEKNVCENSWRKPFLTSGNNDKVWKDQNDSLIANLNRKTLEINDLKAQLQDKTMENNKLK
ncbi:hypothetical protein Tco_0003569 [Tanacetum coccineum]